VTFSSLLGVLLIAFVLFRSWFVISFDAVLTFHFIAALGLAMLASGVKVCNIGWN